MMVNALPFRQVYETVMKVSSEFQDMGIPVHEHEIRKSSAVIPNEDMGL